MVNVDRLIRDGKVFLLAYDQGLEHGPVDLNEVNADPQYIFDIAENSGVFTAIAVQKGLAEKYYQKDVYKTPLVVKLNGKTNYHKGEELFSPQNCSVEYALRLGAVGVGYTVYIGSERENESFVEFSRIVEEAHVAGIPVIMWAYPRGKHIGEGEKSPENIAYAARIALEMGADMVKLAYTGDVASMKWVVKVAGRTKVLAVGGSKTDEETILTKTREIVEAGVAGWAMGRNIWQSENPMEISQEIAKEIFG